MRKPCVAGNWKMNKTVAEARTLVSEMLGGLQEVATIDRVLCPPFTALVPVANLLEGTDVGLGAQNMYWEDSGAFTGEISPPMVKEFCEYVILGHSERRTYFGETDETVNRRLKAAITHNLKSIVCIGETIEEKEANKTAEVLIKQLHGGLSEINRQSAESIMIAYEPVWAIGTGRAASGTEINAAIEVIIRRTLAEILGDDASVKMRILYGGSVNSKNASEFFEQPEIDGALIGGASLKPDEFVKIAQIAAK